MIVILPHNNFQGYEILVSVMDNKRNYNSAKKTALFITVIAPKLMDPKLVPIYLLVKKNKISKLIYK